MIISHLKTYHTESAIIIISREFSRGLGPLPRPRRRLLLALPPIQSDSCVASSPLRKTRKQLLSWHFDLNGTKWSDFLLIRLRFYSGTDTNVLLRNVNVVLISEDSTASLLRVCQASKTLQSFDVIPQGFHFVIQFEDTRDLEMQIL